MSIAEKRVGEDVQKLSRVSRHSAGEGRKKLSSRGILVLGLAGRPDLAQRNL